MRRAFAVIVASTIVSCYTICIAQEQSKDAREYTSGNYLPAPQRDSVEECWADWLKATGLKEGKNELPDGSFSLVTPTITAVNAAVGSKNWLAARDAAFAIAELTARQKLAEGIKTFITSDRKTAIKEFGGDQAPPSLQTAAQQLSLSDKALVLSDKAVDAEIRKYDPSWDGSQAERADTLIKVQARLDTNISNSATLFASGAFTATQCEGPSSGDSGKYSVLIGLVWSPAVQKVAETIWDPGSKAPSVTPDVPLPDKFEQFSKEDPDWMWYTDGARVFTDEHGRRVVVGFGVAPTTSLAAADQSRARLHALAAIQRFVGEKIVSTQTEKGRFELRADESTASFDQSLYENNINAVSKDLELVGTAEVGSWRGEHPWGKVGMQVVAMAWSQEWSKDSAEIGKVLQALETKMQNKGAVPNVRREPPASTAGPAAVKAKRGASSSNRDF